MNPDNVDDVIPQEAEVESAVHLLRPHRADGHTHLHEEHFKQWIQEAYPGEKLKTSPWMERYLCMVDIVRHMALG